MVFADDLNAYRAFLNVDSNETIMKEIDQGQAQLHSRGQANRVSFDACKESKHVLSRLEPAGGNFKILGVSFFDCKLLMDDAAHDVAIECGWKLETMLRSKRFFSGGELIASYKAHALSYIEYRTSAIYHASDTVLSEIDKIQDKML